MAVKRPKFAPAVTLIEIMVAMVILAVAALGALAYQYHAAAHARIAKTEITATRTAQLLLEDWKSTGGSPNYDPTALNLGFSTIEEEPQADYFITIDNLPMYIVLSHDNVDYDPIAEVTLREISVTVRWHRDYSSGAIEADDPALTLTTYVRIDASGG
jgi:prepilin-type N-terminal cleavage/methylation domain-containing protein